MAYASLLQHLHLLKSNLVLDPLARVSGLVLMNAATLNAVMFPMTMSQRQEAYVTAGRWSFEKRMAT
ncbi:hypothetical protein DC522_00035 [Microvirga sp. KLBC 81]|nr:hypothetical protein DC522_00035 [Microvirga sp. KLBC 81]